MPESLLGDLIDSVYQYNPPPDPRLEQAREQGELRPEVDVDDVVHELHVLNDGLSIQAALSPRSAPAEQQTAMVDAVLDRIRTAGP